MCPSLNSCCQTVFGSQGCCNRLPQTRWLHKTGFFLNGSGGHRAQIKVLQGWSLLEAPRGNALQVVPPAPAAAGLLGAPRLVDMSVQSPSTCGSLPRVTVSFPSLSLIRTLAIGFKTPPNSGRSHLEILTLVISAKTLIPNKVPSCGYRSTSLLVGQYSTPCSLARMTYFGESEIRRTGKAIPGRRWLHGVSKAMQGKKASM